MVYSVVLIYSTLTLEFLRDVVIPVTAAVIGSPVCAFSLPPAEAPKSVWLAQPLSPPDLTLQGANGPQCDI